MPTAPVGTNEERLSEPVTEMPWRESDHDRVIAEYARRDINKPIGVAVWQTQLVHSLPEPVRSNLPTIAQIEEELGVGSEYIKFN